MLSDALSDFADSIKIAITNLSDNLAFYEKNDELFDYGIDLIKIIDICKLIQLNFEQNDELNLQIFANLYEFAHSIRVKHDAVY